MDVFSMRSFDVSMGKFGGTSVISGSLQSTLLQKEKDRKVFQMYFNYIQYNSYGD